MKLKIDDSINERIDSYLTGIEELDLTRAKIQNLIKSNNILVNGKPVKTSYKLNMGDEIDINIVEEESIDAYVLCLSKNAQLEAFKVTTMLRSHGFIADTDYLQRSFKAQFKSVDRMKAKVAILIGDKDIENKTVTIKIIETQEQFVVSNEQIIEKMDEIFGERF